MDNIEHIYIYGAGKRGHELLELIKAHYKEKILVDGFIDKCKEGYVDTYKIVKLDECTNKERRIVISVADFETALSIAIELKSENFKSIYWFNTRNHRYVYRDFYTEQCVCCKQWNEATLPHVEIHAMDACNLNCVGCTHYAPIFEKEKPNTNKRIGDIALLRTKISSIVNFFILGGEPLLNDELEKYILTVKNYYPEAAVIVVTNGILIPKCADSFLDFLREENVCISISEYEPTHKMIAKIMDILNKHNVIYNLRPYDKKQMFNKPLSVEKTGECYCISPNCVNVWNQKIARCPTLMYVTELNKKFNLNFPAEGIIELKSAPRERQLKEQLCKSVPLCEYCSKNEIKWATCNKNVSASDFVSI